MASHLPDELLACRATAGRLEAFEELLRRYRNVPMSLADACLVRLSELYGDCAVLTLDSDFRIYRRHGRQVIPVLAPPKV